MTFNCGITFRFDLSIMAAILTRELSMSKGSSSQQRAQRTMRIILLVFSLLIVLSLVLSMLPIGR